MAAAPSTTAPTGGPAELEAELLHTPGPSGLPPHAAEGAGLYFRVALPLPTQTSAAGWRPRHGGILAPRSGAFVRMHGACTGNAHAPHALCLLGSCAWGCKAAGCGCAPCGSGACILYRVVGCAGLAVDDDDDALLDADEGDVEGVELDDDWGLEGGEEGEGEEDLEDDDADLV